RRQCGPRAARQRRRCARRAPTDCWTLSDLVPTTAACCPGHRPRSAPARPLRRGDPASPRARASARGSPHATDDEVGNVAQRFTLATRGQTIERAKCGVVERDSAYACALWTAAGADDPQQLDHLVA